MTLTEYLCANRMTQPQFAEMVGVSQSTVSRWCSGVPPRRRYIAKLRAVTDGAVTLASFEQTSSSEAA
jgi:transcriptional regulator with XRE-family HTH domain